MSNSGEVRVPWEGKEVKAVLDEDGWHCDHKGLLAHLAAFHAPQPSAAGNPYVRALYGAAGALGGAVTREWPVENQPGRIY